jgi:hypothetical protein
MSLTEDMTDEFWRLAMTRVTAIDRMVPVLYLIAQRIDRDCPSPGAKDVASWLLAQINDPSDPTTPSTDTQTTPSPPEKDRS